MFLIARKAVMTDKIEGIGKAAQSMGKDPAESVHNIERSEPSPEQFHQLLDAKQPFKTSFEPLNVQSLPSEGSEKVENHPIVSEEGSTPQKGGSSTDQEGGKKGNKEDQQVEGVSGIGSKKKLSTVSSSLMNEVQKVGGEVKSASALSPGELKAQAKEMISQIGQIKSQLSTVKEIKPAYHSLLKNKLSHIDDNLKIALSKAGIEYKPTEVTAKEGSNPVLRFIDSLTSSQDQLDSIYNNLDSMDKTGQKALSPQALMAVQIKVGYIQQQIELFTNLLNKALESTKTIMNVQV